MSREQRARFLRHALPWRNIRPQRISPAFAGKFDALVDVGSVGVHGGFLKFIGWDGNRAEIVYRLRGTVENTAFKIS
jgi:uncharacterized NAD(P)/FAD-binding protein YdhS